MFPVGLVGKAVASSETTHVVQAGLSPAFRLLPQLPECLGRQTVDIPSLTASLGWGLEPEGLQSPECVGLVLLCQVGY